MQLIRLVPDIFQGHVSLERTGSGIKPWRVPHERRTLFPPDVLNGRGETASGVRLCFESDSDAVEIRFEPFDTESLFDCVIGGELVASQRAAAGAGSVRIDGLGRERKVVEVYLPLGKPISLTGLKVESGSTFAVPDDPRARWITYGSSITECVTAASPAQTWPAIVARRNGWRLTCLGYAANCHLEPNVARMIRDLPADVISLCLGINVYGWATLSPRTFRAAVIGLIEIIREKHAETPIAVLSPILSPERETTPNAMDFTLEAMRDEVHEAVLALEALGDRHLHYTDGRDVFGAAEVRDSMPDGLHPDAEGYRIMGRNFDQRVAKPLQRAYASLRTSA